jgi:hypothetical protein
LTAAEIMTKAISASGCPALGKVQQFRPETPFVTHLQIAKMQGPFTPPLPQFRRNKMKISTLHQEYPSTPHRNKGLTQFSLLPLSRNKGVTSPVEQQNRALTAQEKAGSPFILQSARQMGARPACVLFSWSGFF